MVYRIVWAKGALADLREIHDYIAKDSKFYAKIQVERIQTATLKLARFPKAGRSVPEFPERTWREVLTGNYRLIYRADPDEWRCVVLAVVHGRQLLKAAMISSE